MNLLTFYTLATNFIVFWGIVLYMFISLVVNDAPAGSFVLLIIATVIAAIFVSLMPFFIPLAANVVIGLYIHNKLGSGIWILEFVGAAILLSSMLLLAFLKEITLDSLRARYWKYMWTHKSPLEERIGAHSPYTNMQSEGSFKLLLFPVLSPFFYLGLLSLDDEN